VRTFGRPRAFQNVNAADIAAALGLSDGAVRRYLSDGIHHLNAVLGTAADAGADGPTTDVQMTGGRSHR